MVSIFFRIKLFLSKRMRKLRTFHGKIRSWVWFKRKASRGFLKFVPRFGLFVDLSVLFDRTYINQKTSVSFGIFMCLFDKLMESLFCRAHY